MPSPRSPFSPARSAGVINHAVAFHESTHALLAPNALCAYLSFRAARLTWEYLYPMVPHSRLARRVPVYPDATPALASDSLVRELEGLKRGTDSDKTWDILDRAIVALQSR